MKITLLSSNLTNHNIGLNFIKNISQGLKNYADVVIIDISKNSPIDTILFLKNQKPDIVISYNRVGLLDSVTIDGKTVNLIESLGVPHLCFLVDHPAFLYDYLKPFNDLRHTVFCSPDHINFAKYSGLSGTFSNMIWGCNHINSEDFLPHNERPYDISIAAIWRGFPDNFNFWKNSNTTVKKIIYLAIDNLENDLNRDPFSALLSSITSLNIKFQTNELIKFCSLFGRYAREKDRFNMIEDLAESGLRMAIVGTGWKDFISKRYPKSDILYIDNIPQEKLYEIYKKSKVVACLNSTNGACERIFDAMESGAMIFSEYSPLLHKNFGNESILYYANKIRAESIADLQLSIASSSTQVIANKGIMLANISHTWDVRCKFIFNICEKLLTKNSMNSLDNNYL